MPGVTMPPCTAPAPAHLQAPCGTDHVGLLSPGVAASKYDYRDILLIALPLAVLAISMVTMGILHSWKRSGRSHLRGQQLYPGTAPLCSPRGDGQGADAGQQEGRHSACAALPHRNQLLLSAGASEHAAVLRASKPLL